MLLKFALKRPTFCRVDSVFPISDTYKLTTVHTKDPTQKK